MGENKKGNKFRKGLAVVLASIGLATSAVGCGNNQVTLEEAVEAGVINPDFKDRFEEIEMELNNEEISYEECLKLALKINELQFDAARSEFSRLLDVPENEISFYKKEGDGPVEVVEVGGKYGEKYISKSLISNGRNTISGDISKYIYNISEMQNLIGRLQNNESLDKNDLVKDYKKYMDIIAKFLTGELKMDENGNISIVYINIKDIER